MRGLEIIIYARKKRFSEKCQLKIRKIKPKRPHLRVSPAGENSLFSFAVPWD
jgi:hypothetical protein